MIFLLCVLLAAAPSKTNLQTGQYGELIIWTSNFIFYQLFINENIFNEQIYYFAVLALSDR